MSTKTQYQFPDFNFLDYDYSLTKNLNFYNIEIEDPKKKKEWALAYWKKQGKNTKEISKLSDGYFNTVGSVAHMIAHRNIELEDKDILYLEKKYREFYGLIPKTAPKEKPETSKENMQADELRVHLGEFDCGVDMFFGGEIFDAKKYLIRNDVKPSMTKQIAENLKPMLKEVKLAALNKDEQLTESYSHMSVRRLKKFIEYLQSMIASCEVASAITKAARKPKTKREKAPSEVVKNVTYQIEDGVSKLKSIHPSKIINSKEVWLYNTKNRRLFRYVALEGMSLSVKGVTIINVDQEKSGGKIIRKPEVQLKGIQSMTSRPLNKLFNDIRSTMSRAAGRLNGETIIVTAL